MDVAVLAAGVGLVLAGALFLAYGATLILTGQDASTSPYPNTQHISTTPGPRR